MRYFRRTTPAKKEEITLELEIIGEIAAVSTELEVKTMRDTRTKGRSKNAKSCTEKRAKQEEIISE